MYNKINYEVLVQILIEVFMALIIGISLATGRINDLVHPKFNLILGITALVLVLIAVFSIPSLFRPTPHNYR